MTCTKHRGAEVHKEGISIAVLNGAGRLVMECVIETKASTFCSLSTGSAAICKSGLKKVPGAGRLYDLLKPQLKELVAGNPRKMALLKEGRKGDRIGARKLADLLYMNKIKSVYHGEHDLRMLRE